MSDFGVLGPEAAPELWMADDEVGPRPRVGLLEGIACYPLLLVLLGLPVRDD